MPLIRPLSILLALTLSTALKDSPVVFVGYGIVAPERDWNDYAGIDVRDKTVVILVYDPG